MNFRLIFIIIKNINKSPSHMNELINDQLADEKIKKMNASNFLLALYQMEAAGLVFRYQVSNDTCYVRTEKGEKFYEKYREISEANWPFEINL